jgi:mono/diheme cytochrome c family protein
MSIRKEDSRLVSRRVVLVAALAASLAALGLTKIPAAPTSPGAAAVASIERGRYLTHDVAMCVQCHSPRDEKGRILEGKEFLGAPMPIQSPYPTVAKFAFNAPNIRELARSHGDSVVRLLRTGIDWNGKAADLPMPPFRMSAEDAESIVLYLRSLD